MWVTIKKGSTVILACIASVSVGFSARLRHFLFFGIAKIEVSTAKNAVKSRIEMLATLYTGYCDSFRGLLMLSFQTALFFPSVTT